MDRVLVLGDERLLVISEAIDPRELNKEQQQPLKQQQRGEEEGCPKSRLEVAIEDCAIALESFRAKEGYGRAISAVQVGHPLRVVFLNLGKTYVSLYGEQFGTPFAMINPELHNLSGSRQGRDGEISPEQTTFTMWDDCLSLPNMMVRVRRSKSCDVTFLDVKGKMHCWRNLPLPLAELLQVCIFFLTTLLVWD